MGRRNAGILLHPTSLPGCYGIGDLGPEAAAFLDWSARAGLSVWQMLPLVPPGPDGAPYSALSAFAANPMLISPVRLAEAGWLPSDAPPPPRLPRGRVDFPRTVRFKNALLRRSWSHFLSRATPADRQELESFVRHPDQACWLDDWSLFASIRNSLNGRPWIEWDDDLRRRQPRALDAARERLAGEIDFQRYLQFVFLRQWRELRDEARDRGIALVGDVPIYVAHDSADVWARPELFQLDDRGLPINVAGVPPDYFSETGQLWGNPLYRWERMADDGYRWWIDRLRTNLRLTDRVRLDHFRGFAAYWEVGASEPTAIDGRWVQGPGQGLFDALRAALGGLPFLAEDLGDITPDVHELRELLGLPGMRVLQFGLGDDDGDHRPNAYGTNCVAYTGTHDNDTGRGWFESLEPEARQPVLDRLSATPGTVVRRMIETIYASAAGTVIVPLQDLLDLGHEARMNRPGVAAGNWSWRAPARRLTDSLAAGLRALARSTDRLGARRDR